MRISMKSINIQAPAGTAWAGFACVWMAVFAAPAPAQSVFGSGSTGADGPLVYHAPPPARYDSAMAFDANRGVAVLFGGSGAGGALGDTWEWDGVRWNRIQTQFSPPSRAGHAMAYDSDRNVTVLFGGLDSRNQRLADTWEYDGANWTPIETAEAPPGRQNHAMVYHESIRAAVLFGGNTGSTQNDTWTWDGQTWTQIAAASPPSARDWHAMAHDPVRQRTVLFGGNPNGAETWEFDGAEWTRPNPADSPQARWGHMMAYDSRLESVILFGGSSITNDLWAWNGQNWTALPSAERPAGRSRGAIADGTSNTVLFGGLGPATLDDTWLWDGEWTKPSQTQSDTVFDMSDRPDGVWNFTTVDIPAGVTVRFSPNAFNTPVYWLASGGVTIGGSIVLDGGIGTTNPNPGNEAPGGPGGYAGGLGGRRFDVSGSYAGTPGRGPGGGLPGAASGQNGGNGGYAAPGGTQPLDGEAYGSPLLMPLLGGSGGGGGGSRDTSNGGGGGGGGGAILIASSGSIIVNGRIQANGGQGGGGGSFGGRGSGGAIRLVANRIEGTGTLRAEPNGYIRTEAFFVQIGGTINPVNSAAPPIAVRLEGQGAIRIDEIAGQAVPANPGGNTNSPDVIFTETGEITILMSTTNIPEGTVITVRITSGGQAVLAQSTPVDAGGNATATASVPPGVGTIQAYADY